jgi:hypothetical protein
VLPHFAVAGARPNQPIPRAGQAPQASTSTSSSTLSPRRPTSRTRAPPDRHDQACGASSPDAIVRHKTDMIKLVELHLPALQVLPSSRVRARCTRPNASRLASSMCRRRTHSIPSHRCAATTTVLRGSATPVASAVVSCFRFLPPSRGSAEAPMIVKGR